MSPRPDRAQHARALRSGSPDRRGGARRIKARAALARCLWDKNGDRLLPSRAALDRALSQIHADDLEWLMEFNPLGPLYFLPTREWCRAATTQLRKLGVKRIVEIGAGDGFLSASLSRVDPALEFIATDSGAWTKAAARMSAEEKRLHRGHHVAGILSGQNVERIEARAAIEKYKPDLVVASWLPPKFPLSRVLRCDVRYLLEIGAAGGVTPGAWNWRYAHELCEGPIERLARCRLDARPARELSSRVTLYFGAAHPEFHCERVRPGDWLWQFRPV